MDEDLDYVKRLEEAYLEAMAAVIDEYGSPNADADALDDLNQIRAEFGLPPRT